MNRNDNYWLGQEARHHAATTARLGGINTAPREHSCRCPCGCIEYTCAGRCKGCTHGSFGRHDAVWDSDWQGDLTLALARQRLQDFRATVDALRGPLLDH